MSVYDNYNHNLLVTDVKILVLTMIKMMIILIIISAYKTFRLYQDPDSSYFSHHNVETKISKKKIP